MTKPAPKTSPGPKPAAQKEKKSTASPALGKMAFLDNALTRVKEKAEISGVDYIGVLKSAEFVPTAVEIKEEPSVRVILERLGALKAAPEPEAPKIEAQNVNVGAPKKAKAATKEDEFLKRSKPTYTEDVIEVPKDFAAEFFVGGGYVPKIYNVPVMTSRLGWKYGYAVSFGSAIETLDGTPVGTLAKIRLDDVWAKATRRLSGDERHPITEDQFKKCLSAVKTYIGKAKRQERDTNTPIFITDFFEINELDYRELMLPHASEFAGIVKLACEYDMAETKSLLARWRRIRKYGHKVPLGVADDGLGIFSSSDVTVLSAYGIKTLNDIKMHNVIELKNLLLEKDFARLVEDINAAFKEDGKRRLDAAFKSYPFPFAFISLVFAIFINLNYQYTIIKETLGATILNYTFVVWILGLVIMLIGAIRAPLRRKKHPSYHFFTRRIKHRSIRLAILSVLTIAMSLVFFHRYDGYNNNVYYRFLDDNTITIAGRVEGASPEMRIPESIDGYTVVSISDRAFKDEYIISLELPKTVETIGKYAFSGCDALEQISATFGECGVKTVKRGAFEKCRMLVSTDILATVETLEKGVFKDSGIESVALSSIKTIEAGAFKNVESLKSVSLSESLAVIPESCFEGCMYITEISRYDAVTTIEKKAFKDCMAISDISLSNVKVIGENALEGCISLTKISISDTVGEIGKNAFKNCNNVLVFETPFIGKNAAETAKYSFDYFINCNNLKKPFSVVLRGMSVIHSKAFEDCASIVSVDFGDDVTEIQAGAFKNAKSLESITLPEVISTVAEEAFMGCDNLSEIIGMEHVTVIESSAFEGCSSISDINLSAVEVLGDNAFFDCYTLKTISNVQSLTQIGAYAFGGCWNLTELDFTDSKVSVIGEGAFSDCFNLNTVKLPDSVTEIPEGMLHYCYNLNEFEFSSSIRTIGKEAFADSGINSVTFNDSLVEIGEGAFMNCSDISRIIIPSSVQSIGKNAFKNCYTLNYVEAPFFGTSKGGKDGSDKVYGTSNNIQYIVATGSGTITKNDTKAFKSSLIGVKLGGTINEIGEDAFKNFKINEISLGESVKIIGESAFSGCQRLSSFSFEGAGVGTIGASAFKDCDSLSSFTAGSALHTIGESAFAGSYIITLDLSAASELREIPKKLCYGCYNLERIEFPAYLDMIGESAFAKCEAIGSVSLENVKTIGKGAFKNCDELETLYMENVTVIEDEAFASTYLYEVEIPDGCTKLGKNVFKNCKYLEALYIPTSVSKMGKGLFAGCKNLESLQIPYIGTDKDTPKKISALGYYRSLSTVAVSDAKEIGKNAFKNCENLERLYLNDGIGEIHEKAFGGCESLTTVYLPKSLEKFESIFPIGSVVYPKD